MLNIAEHRPVLIFGDIAMISKNCGLSLACFAAALFAGPVAQAATMSSTQMFTIPPMMDVRTNFELTGGTFQNFNTALGTLTGVSLTFAGPASIALVFTTNDTQDTFEIARVGPNFTGAFAGFRGFAINAGSTSFDFSAFGTASGSPSLFLQPGTTELDLDLDISARGISAGTATLTSRGPISETLTYIYTPAATSSVPEPESMVLLGVGLIGLVAARRRRTA